MQKYLTEMICTWINGIYCTDKTVEEVNAELMANMEVPVIVISTNSGWDYYDGLTNISDMDKAFELVKNAITKGQYEINIDELDCFYDIPFTEEHTMWTGSWRSKFGGEIYKTNGSHGCVNTLTDIMAQLYDMLEIGTPVILFY